MAGKGVNLAFRIMLMCNVIQGDGIKSGLPCVSCTVTIGSFICQKNFRKDQFIIRALFGVAVRE